MGERAMGERAVSRTGKFHRRSATAAAALLAALTVAIGCETSQPGTTNSLGTVRTTFEASPAAVTRAAEQALTDLGLTIVTTRSTADDGMVVARTANRREVNVLVDRESDELTQVSIRVGLAGDPEASVGVLRRIRARLAEQEPTEPAATQAEQTAEDDQP